jgi:ubiquinone biosynthesis protein UbiJ
MRTKNPTTEARYKRAAGIQLNPDQAALVQAYDKADALGKICFHPGLRLKQEWRALASVQGVPLSAWLTERIQGSLQPNDEVHGLRAENEQLRDELTKHQRALAKAMTDKTELETANQDLEGKYREMAELILRLQAKQGVQS